MPFTKFISIVLEILGCYYFVIILFDLLRSGNKPVQVTTHAVQFNQTEKPVMIVGEQEEAIQRDNSWNNAESKEYTPHQLASNKKDKRKTPLIDLGLETVSGEPYTVNAENLSKFMKA